jgi:hypothetical protein
VSLACIRHVSPLAHRPLESETLSLTNCPVSADHLSRSICRAVPNHCRLRASRRSCPAHFDLATRALRAMKRGSGTVMAGARSPLWGDAAEADLRLADPFLVTLAPSPEASNPFSGPAMQALRGSSTHHLRGSPICEGPQPHTEGLNVLKLLLNHGPNRPLA